MLGKQWLNRYASIDMRGSAIERSQNRQRKLDGVVTWYFDHVMESLPLMLQSALFLLGCALSRYLWDIDTTIASVVLGVTSFGVASYIFFIVAGGASASCPYQIPILRQIPPLALSALRSASSHSKAVNWITDLWRFNIRDSEYLIGDAVHLLALTLLSPIILSVCLAIDAYLLAQAMVKAFVANAPRMCSWFHRTHGLDPQITTSDLQCVSWMLRTSLEKSIHLLALKLLAMMTTLANLHPALVPACFDILVGCVSTVGGKVVVLQGSEELAGVSALCCLRTLAHLTTIDPASSVFKDVRRTYTKTFPIETDFKGFPSCHRFSIIHNIFHPPYKQVQFQNFERPKIQWTEHTLSSTEHVALVQLARFEYQGNQCRNVPDWILGYALRLLSQDPLPTTSVVADCLSIVAIELGLTALDTTTLDERYVRLQ